MNKEKDSDKSKLREPNRRKHPRDYVLPLKIDGIVESRKEELEQRVRLQSETPSAERCPLLGYNIEIEDKEYVPPELLKRGVVISAINQKVELNVGGCSALRDPVCYVIEGTRKRGKDYEPVIPKVDCKENCPVYVRVLEVLVKLSADEPKEVVRYVSTGSSCSCHQSNRGPQDTWQW